ncbi:class I SAM-dependent methyltransferase [Mycetocola spongiae]|uniref:class I SAM-dependent methyltransferase n=1 Tax=Mycetocola spongiae TaxID=2859226 RepID=UPI001CF5479A|nr:methyltransferase [Mycetocola spongiae]UCR89967.1 methyltransferase [Mycetocola spongiae]
MSTEHYFDALPGGDASYRQITAWIAGAEREVTTANKVFSPGHIDGGTRILLDAVPEPPTHGNILDLGAGWGPIALELAILSPEATIWAVDVNERALDLVRRNAQALGLENIRAVTPEQVPAEITFAAIWSNPPIRVGKEVLHNMLEHWLPRLEVQGEAWLVVAKDLGADSLQRWIAETLGADFEVSRVSTSKGFRVLLADRVA